MRELSKNLLSRSTSPDSGPFHIAEITRADVRSSSDLVDVLRSLIATNDPQYPGIEIWYKKKVVPGLLSGERKAYLAFCDDKPVGAAILRKGRSAKFCHLRIERAFQGSDLGQIFFIHMIMDVLGEARDIHFTLPESLWADKAGFFKSFGFSNAAVVSRRYRNGDGELSCSAPISAALSAALKKLPYLLRKCSVGNYSGSSELLLSMKPKFARRIIGGSKSVEIRKRFSDKWAGHDVILCATRPLGCVLGRANVESVVKGSPREIWDAYHEQLGCSRVEFDAYVRGAATISAIQLGGVDAYESPVRIKDLANLLCRKLLLPQSFAEIVFGKNADWKRALYAASLFRRKNVSPNVPL